jgi:hypothetical protein
MARVTFYWWGVVIAVLITILHFAVAPLSKVFL